MDSGTENLDFTRIRATIHGENKDGPDELGTSAKRGDIPLSRGSGYPMKRFFHSENHKIDTDFIHGGNNNGHFDLRIKSHISKGKGEKNDSNGIFSFKGRSLLFSILISIVVACFVLEGMLQSSLFRHTEFVPGLVGFVEKKPLLNTLSFGDTVKFVPLKLEEQFRSRLSLDEMRRQQRNPIRPTRLAVVSPYLSKTPSSLLLITIAKGLLELGYHLEVYALNDGPSHSAWENIGCSVTVLELDAAKGFAIDWSNFEGVVLNTLESKKVVTSLMQEPFCSIPVIWIIEEDTLANRLGLYASNGWNGIISEWSNAFGRADVIVFPNYALAMMYGSLDTGNFYVIPGSPYDTWVAEKYSILHEKNELRMSMGLPRDDFVILVVGSPFFYSAIWWEHTMVMQAVHPLAQQFFNGHHRKMKLIILSNNTTGHYDVALQAIALHLGFPKGTVQHYSLDVDVNKIICVSDLIIYGSLREEQAFPPILIRAMSFKKPVIVPNLSVIEKHVTNGTNALVFPGGNVEVLTKTISRAISRGKLSSLALKIADSGKAHAKNLLALDTALGYMVLFEKILQFPSEVFLPKSISSLPRDARSRWQWQLLNDSNSLDIDQESENVLEEISETVGEAGAVFDTEERWNISLDSMSETQNFSAGDLDEVPRERDWDDQRYMEMMEEVEQREEQELEERTEPFRGSWDDIYKMTRKAERTKFELNERDEGELERTGQPICIYEFYYGSGTWPFLHTGALYRAINLYPKGRRAGADDVSAVDRLPLLNNSYYNHVFCEIGGFFAIANKVDTIHKSPWIGFQSWRAIGRKVSLSTEAEKILVDKAQSGINGDTVYFWARSDKDTSVSIQGLNQQTLNDFWSYCDILNAGKCRIAFKNAFRQMYDLPLNMSALPPMPYDGDSWSVLNSWAMPTTSFLEFVMFSRMFVDALDRQHYEEHHDNGTCIFGISKLEVKHCYCRLVELLVNVWAYHSARRMIYINPSTGVCQEQHNLSFRKAHMWYKYFNFTLLKSMDEDLAEEADDGLPNKRWLWPLTGEVHWQGIYEREREERYRQKMEKKRKNKEKLLERLRYGYKQKSLGKYFKPPPDSSVQAEKNAADH